MFERKINYYETDQMGVVHHSNYIRYFEEARCELMEEKGAPYAQLEKLGILIPVIGARCEYKSPAKFGDTIIIRAGVTEFKGIRMTVSYVIENKATKELLATGETKHCFVDEDLKPLNLKKRNLDFYDKMLACVVEEG